MPEHNIARRADNKLLAYWANCNINGTNTYTNYTQYTVCRVVYMNINAAWLLLCGRPDRPHYVSCSCVRPSVRPSGLLIREQESVEKPKLA